MDAITSGRVSKALSQLALLHERCPNEANFALLDALEAAHERLLAEEAPTNPDRFKKYLPASQRQTAT